MEQVIIGGYDDQVHTSATEYNRIAGGEDWENFEGARLQAVSTDGKLKQLRVELGGTPGGGGNYKFTLRLNGAPTALTCTVGSADLQASDMVNEVVVTGGDLISLECDPDSPAQARKAQWTIVFEGDNPNESLLLGAAQSALPGGSTNMYNQVAPTGEADWAANEARMTQIIPTAGKIKNLYVELSTDPGTAPDAWRFTLRLDNGGGFGDTALECTIVANDTKGNDLINEITVAAGDKVTFQCDPISGPSATAQAYWGFTFVADTDGESLILGGTDDAPATGSTEFCYLTGYQFHINVWTGTENDRRQLGQVCELKNLYVELENDPNPGDFAFTVKINGGAGNLTVTITSGNTTGNDLVNTDTLSDDDNLGFESNPDSSPTSGNVYWSLMSYIEPGSLGSKSPHMAEKMVAGKLI